MQLSSSSRVRPHPIRQAQVVVLYLEIKEGQYELHGSTFERRLLLFYESACSHRVAPFLVTLALLPALQLEM